MAVNFISGVTQYYEIPAASTYVSNNVSGPITWSGGSGVDASGSAALSVTDCTSATVTGCTAAPNSALSTAGGSYTGFDGPNPTFPYLEVTTGSTPIGAGATLVLPTVTVTLKASGAVGTVLNWSQFEFDTSANITLFSHAVSANIVAWPSKLEYDATTTTPCNGLTPSSGSCPSITFVPLNAVNAAGNGTGTLDSGLEYGPPPVLTSTTISPPAPFINVTNTPPINSTATGVTINVSGANWPASETTGTSLTFSGCTGTATCSDTGTFTTDASGNLSGSINFTANEQEPTSQNPITLTVTASDGTNTTTASVTVNPFQSFQETCSVGQTPNSTCTINQTISAAVLGTSLTISEIQTGPNGSNSAVTLSPVTLGLGTGTNNTQFAQAQGLLNSVVVSDDRGTLTGWDVTGQLGGNFQNQASHGPSLDNTIPADFLTWEPGVVLETTGGLPADNANSIGCPNHPGGIPTCDGPSGLPSTTGVAGGAGGNGTGAAVTSTSAPAEVTAGPIAVLNNSDVGSSAAELCGTNTAPGGGGGFVCSAGLSLAVPPYVASGIYQATMNIVVIGY